jgi:hypothetical protein
MSWLFRSAQKTDRDEGEELERRAAAMRVMKDLCKDLIEPSQVSFLLSHTLSPEKNTRLTGGVSNRRHRMQERAKLRTIKVILWLRQE